MKDTLTLSHTSYAWPLGLMPEDPHPCKCSQGNSCPQVDKSQERKQPIPALQPYPPGHPHIAAGPLCRQVVTPLGLSWLVIKKGVLNVV